MGILVLIIMFVLGVAAIAFAAVVVLALLIGIVRYALNPQALIADLRDSIQKRV